MEKCCMCYHAEYHSGDRPSIPRVQMMNVARRCGAHGLSSRLICRSVASGGKAEVPSFSSLTEKRERGSVEDVPTRLNMTLRITWSEPGDNSKPLEHLIINMSSRPQEFNVRHGQTSDNRT